VVRSRQSGPSRARPDPSRSGRALEGARLRLPAYSASAKDICLSQLNRSIRVRRVFQQIGKSFSEFP
jgi:hypothetical protein